VNSHLCPLMIRIVLIKNYRFFLKELHNDNGNFFREEFKTFVLSMIEHFSNAYYSSSRIHFKSHVCLIFKIILSFSEVHKGGTRLEQHVSAHRDARHGAHARSRRIAMQRFELQVPRDRNARPRSNVARRPFARGVTAE